MDTSTTQVSTAVSDLMLCFVSFHAAIRLYGTAISASIAMLIHGIAASIGVMRFGVYPTHGPIIRSHEFMSWLGSSLSCPLLAVSFYQQEEFFTVANVFLAVSIADVLVCFRLNHATRKRTASFTSTASILAILFLSLYRFKPHALIGTLLYAIAGIAVGTEGVCTRFRLRCVDVFHYVLCLANLALMLSLVNRPMLVYYRPSLVSS